MRFELFVATRYLRAKRRQAIIGVITGISILGVAAGVASLIVALAINNGFRQAFFLCQYLPARFVADDTLEIPHHHRVRMRAIDGAEDVMRGTDVGDPVAPGLVDGFFLRACLPLS